MFRSLFTTPTTRSPHGQRTAVKQMTVHELYERIANNDSDLELIDVRSPGEYQYDGHVAGSRLLPLPSLMQRVGELPKDKTVVCICRSGSRSYAACEMLAAQGFDAINLSGGMMNWKMAGLPYN